MLRFPRTVASLLQALTLTAPTLSMIAVPVILSGCKDENQPDYWVDKLSDRAWQGKAVARLEQFFEDTFSRSNKDLTAAEMKALADKVIDPLAKLYVDSYADLDEKTRESTIKLVAAFRDKRGEAAMKKAFEEFAKSGKGADDVKWAARAAGEMGVDSVAEAMGQAFDKLKASSKEGASVYRDLNEAMLKHPSKAWSGLLKLKLQPEITQPSDAKDPSAVDKFKNELFWQTTAAQLLGEIKDETAVEPLLKIMLDPAKADVQATAVLALVKIGKPAAERAKKILADQDQDMANYSTARTQKFEAEQAKKSNPTNPKSRTVEEIAKDKPHVPTAAVILGSMGRPETLDAMLAAVGAEKDASNRAVIAREIAKIPATDASKAAFKTAYEATPLSEQIPPGANALQTLTEAAGSFYDPTMVPWLLDRAGKTTGNDDEKKLLQSTATITAIKLMKPDQIGAVNEAVGKWGTQVEKDAFALASEMLKACTTQVPCYLTAIEKGDNQSTKKQQAGIKAGYMVGVFGDAKARDDLIKSLGAIDNAAVRYVASQTIDYLSPKGSKEAAAALDAIIDKNAKSADKNKSAGDAPLKQVMYRIGARAE